MSVTKKTFSKADGPRSTGINVWLQQTDKKFCVKLFMSVIGDSFTGCKCEEDCSQKECCLKFSENGCSIKIKATDKIAHLISLSKLY